ncbi:MAG: hypothetical protein ACI9TV_002329 [Sulfurimonas sp.]|jgi:hypothetical protein|uniref:STAS/SEC14 domain-containing protein n=1 Tax=Sulfurimonas sp. TaxID=2022749 RepID=UPI0039E56D48
MDTHIEHGISVGISRVNESFFIKMKVSGTLTHNDYNAMVPILRDSLQSVKEPQVNILVDGTELDSFELRAAWDDFKFGLEFDSVFRKIAYVGTKSWEEYGITISNWFVSGEIRFFESFDEAYAWLSQEEVLPTTPIEKDLHSRKDSIRNDLESLFKSHMRVTDYNVPEPNDQDVSELLIDILSEKLDEIKDDVKNGMYKNY